MPNFIYSLPILETVDLSQNKIADWNADSATDFRKCSIRHLDVQGNELLEAPPADFLRHSSVNKLMLVGCSVEKGDLMRHMERNGV